MSDNGVDTEIELRNGGDYRLYKMYEVSELGEWTDKGVEVDLRRAFAIKVQNASATLVLNLAIVNRSSGNIVFRKSAGKYGVVQAGN